MKQETRQQIEIIKQKLNRIGSVSAAISGVAMGILSIIRVFYPDLQKPNSTTNINNTK